MLKYSQFILQPMRDFKFKVLHPIPYRDIVIPVGFTSDGASVPRLFWVIYPPNRTDYLPCAIIHDYLCDLKQYSLADDYFWTCMCDLHINNTSKYPIITAVKAYHTIRYRLLPKIRIRKQNGG